MDGDVHPTGGREPKATSFAKTAAFWRWRPKSLSTKLQWIPANWNWTGWKPAIRSALAAWIGLLLFIIPATLNVLGKSQAAFLIIIAAFLSPPSDSFPAVLVREIGILTFATIGWAWSCLGIKLANLARSNYDLAAPLLKIFTAQYLEPAPTVIMGVFLFIGSCFFLYIKSRVGLSPLIFACIFGCISIDVILTTAVLFPYPCYKIGQLIVVPLAFHSAISLILSLVFFPSSESAVFSLRLQGVLGSLVTVTKGQRQCLQQDVTAPDFSAAQIVEEISKAESALPLLAYTAHVQKIDIVYSRFAPADYTQIHALIRQLIFRARGMTLYYALIDPTREKFPTLTPSAAATPRATVSSLPTARSHGLPLHLALPRAAKKESAVGVFESCHYLNLEATHWSHPDSETHIAQTTELLSHSCQDLLESSVNGLQGAVDWLRGSRDNTFNFWVSREEKNRLRADRIKNYEELHRELSHHLDDFTNNKRFTVLDPYRAIFTSTDEALTESDIVPHRHLFSCFVHQYHLMRFATSIQDMLGEIIRLENERATPRVWFPTIHWSRLIHRSWEPSEGVGTHVDEDPDIIPGLDPESDLGQAVHRDPDALPPRNVLEKCMNWIYHVVRGMGDGDLLYAVKAGILTILLSLPSFLSSSAEFAYKNKFVWAVIMGQLTITRFLGDTTFGIVARIFSTFVGGLVGTVVWYISTGSGNGNAYGLAAVCFVCFPFFFYCRFYWPAHPMTNMTIWVTAALIFGYSYLDEHLPPSLPGYSGIDIAWKRFVLVATGVVAAGIFSFLPPSMTIRLHERKTLATTSTEMGSIYCSVISFGNTKKEGETAVIVQRILAVLSKLKRSMTLKQLAVFEVSFRGKWPAERYQRILELQIQILGLLSHLTSVLERLEPAWAQAFLKRMRLSDGDFLGDLLAVITMISSSLRTGNPLPQVTPCPLLNRFIERPCGLKVVHEESEEDFGLPKVLTEETLESLQYMTFCVGVSTVFAIVTRLDKLIVAVKELVGEQYHIDGVGLPLYINRQRNVDAPAVNDGA